MSARWLTPKEAAETLGVSESTLWRLLRSGRLPSVKLGGRRRISPAALGQVERSVGPVVRPSDIPAVTLEDTLLRMMGRFRGPSAGTGARDKHRHLGVKR